MILTKVDETIEEHLRRIEINPEVLMKIIQWKEDAEKFGWAIRKLKQLTQKNKRLTESLRNPEYEYGYTHIKNKDWNEIKKKIEIEKRLKKQIEILKSIKEFPDGASPTRDSCLNGLQKILENKE